VLLELSFFRVFTSEVVIVKTTIKRPMKIHKMNLQASKTTTKHQINYTVFTIFAFKSGRESVGGFCDDIVCAVIECLKIAG
jgi:hypothetical protein